MSSDLLVKVIRIKETEKVSLLSDHSKAVRSASWDPQGKFLVRHDSIYLSIECILAHLHSGDDMLRCESTSIRHVRFRALLVEGTRWYHRIQRVRVSTASGV